MSATITIGSTVISPQAVTGYESVREGQSIVHDILGRSNPDVTLRPSGLRRGTLHLAFIGTTAEADSLAAENAHALAGVAALTVADHPTASMSYIVPGAGSIKRSLSPETMNHWLLELDFQEVLP